MTEVSCHLDEARANGDSRRAVGFEENRPSASGVLQTIIMTGLRVTGRESGPRYSRTARGFPSHSISFWAAASRIS